MKKDFDDWNEKKKHIDTISMNMKHYHERQVWWCALGVNVGFEQDGSGEEYQRPVLILKAMSKKTCYVVPLTTSVNSHRYRIPIGLIENQSASAIISQVRLIDTKRLVNKIGFLDAGFFSQIRKAVKSLF